MSSALIHRTLFALAALILAAAPSTAKDVEEKFDDGKVKLRYRVDAKDHKNGDYLEFFPNGRTAVRGSYALDKKNGNWTIFADTGKTLETVTYRDDDREGPYQHNYPDGRPQMRGTYHANELTGVVTTFDVKGTLEFNLNYPIPKEAVLKAWNTWSPVHRDGPKMLEEPTLTAPFKAGRMAGESQDLALKYMMLYRFLSGVTVANMAIDPGYVEKCQYGAVLLHDLGHLEHTPAKPANMDESFFKLGYAGTSSSNISQGRQNLFDSIDDYMDDSDAHNIERVGHRQWILTPALQKTGFGYADGFSTLYSFDGAARSNMNWTYIAYPGPGYYPHQMLRDGAAFSLSLNPQKVKIPTIADLDITVYTVDEHFAVTEKATAKTVAIPMAPAMAAWPCVIFHTNVGHPGVGRYVVQVAGLFAKTGQPAPLTYLVDVQELPKPEPPTAKKPAEAKKAPVKAKDSDD